MKMYRLNDGLLYIYVKVPNKSLIEFVKKAWYADLSMGVKEYYEAEYAENFIERRVRILMDKSLTRQHVIIIGEKQYQVGRVWSGRLNRLNKTYDEFALGAEFTDITLERAEHSYEINGV